MCDKCVKCVKCGKCGSVASVASMASMASVTSVTSVASVTIGKNMTSVTENITMNVMCLITPKATAKHELFFNKSTLEARLLNIQVGLKHGNKVRHNS